jgi:hypothetical protein
MAKKAPDPIVFAKAVLRRASSRGWYARNEVYKRVKVSRGVYRCEGCNGHFKANQLQIDHIEPVVDIKTGFLNLENWVLRLLVGPEKLQALCQSENDEGEQFGCHAVKTKTENDMREFYKSKKVRKK